MRIVFVFLFVLVTARVATAAQISGTITDPSGAVVPSARVVVREIATGVERQADTDSQGRYQAEAPSVGSYLVIVTREGFSAFTRTVDITSPSDRIDVPVALELGPSSIQLTITPARSERDQRQIPLHIETLPKEAILGANALSTGDAIAAAVSVTPVGNGPFGVRPRLRGLDSTRLLVLVDGERLNTARTATDRAGIEVGLVATDEIERVEVIAGAGSLMYGTDALAGTVHIITNEPTFTETRRWVYGFNGFFSSNEKGWRGSLSLGASAPRYAVRIQGGAEGYDEYTAGSLTNEDTRPFFASGQLARADTIDNNFPGFNLRAFPDPFNAPFVRTDNFVPNSASKGNFVSASGLIKLSDTRSVRVRYQRRRVSDTGFPDFVEPYFFNVVRLPQSDFDRVSARYEARAITRWLANLSVTAYYQRQKRTLENRFPVQFPAPAATFFPISVMRLHVRSLTGQRVWTPGVDAQAAIVPAPNHLLTTGLTIYRDSSQDDRLTETTSTMVGQVVAGPRGPSAVVFPQPVVLGPSTVSRPVRVPNATFRDIGFFAQDEWKVQSRLSVIAGLRGDLYAVTTASTPGYDVSSLIAGARPAIDPSTLPDPSGATYARKALTGDIGVIGNPDGRVSPYVRFGRSFRHPNLEELLFAGPATAGNIIPNVTVKPEKGNNFDAGAKISAGSWTGGAFFFLNQYRDFIASELVIARTAAGPLTRATNFANVRIHGLELQAQKPFVTEPGVLTLNLAGAFMRGAVTDGQNPLDGSSLSGTPADNITPSKVTANVRYTESGARWWSEYGVRAQGSVDRVALTVLESPFLIAQDLLSLDAFVVHRLGAGVRLGSGLHRATLTVAVENLANRYYREQFQFAPARGRSFTVGVRIGS
ncbi:MAG: TonB-dependent receptor [Acidimicrobiia bacterium]|nr:TonB-dependent receptor [Acidimicrobiia bacterium]